MIRLKNMPSQLQFQKRSEIGVIALNSTGDRQQHILTVFKKKKVCCVFLWKIVRRIFILLQSNYPAESGKLAPTTKAIEHGWDELQKQHKDNPPLLSLFSNPHTHTHTLTRTHAHCRESNENKFEV